MCYSSQVQVVSVIEAPAGLSDLGDRDVAALCRGTSVVLTPV